MQGDRADFGPVVQEGKRTARVRFKWYIAERILSRDSLYVKNSVL